MLFVPQLEQGEQKDIYELYGTRLILGRTLVKFDVKSLKVCLMSFRSEQQGGGVETPD